MAYIPSTGSVVSYQSVPSSLLSGASIFGQLPGGTATLGSVAAIVSNFPSNSSVSGVTGASIIGVGHANQGEGASATVQLAVTGFNRYWNGGTWDRAAGNSSIGALVSTGASSVILATGSVLAFQAGTQIVSVISSTPSSLLAGVSIIGVALGNANDGLASGIQLSTTAFNRVWNGATWDRIPGNSAIGQIVTTGASSVILATGSVLAFQAGTRITSVVSSTPSSMLTGASIFGQLPAGTAVLGSVATLQGTNPWNIAGSVLSVPTSPSIVGTYAEDTQSSAGDKGLMVLGVRNDTFASLTNADGDYGSLMIDAQGRAITRVTGLAYLTDGTELTTATGLKVIGSVTALGTYAEDAAHTTGDLGLFSLAVRNDTLASTVSADKDYTAFATDSAGRTITKPFVSDDGTIIKFTSSTVSTSVMLIQASAIGKRSYVTDFWISNTGANATLVTFQDGSTSVLGYTIAPAGGGSNSQGIHVPLRTAPSQDLALKPGTGTSILYVTVQGYQAP